MNNFQLLFWVSLAILFYAYFGYGLLVLLINNARLLFSRRKVPETPLILPVTIIIPAYNEGPVLKQKLINTRSLDYPADKLKVIVVSDGSTDDTPAIMKQFPEVQWMHQEERQGKYAALARAIRETDSPVTLFTDANAMLNAEAVRMIVAHYQDPLTGGVAGEKKVLRSSLAPAVGEAEGIYWQYESQMKKLDDGFYTVVGAAGELFSIRTALFPVLTGPVILDDFMISMKICLAGYKIAYEPDAFATEWPSASLADEQKRKVRIAAGAYQSLGPLRACLNFFRHPRLAFQFFSRRFLRWVFCPFLLPLLLLANIMLVIRGYGIFYDWALFAQGLSYGLALLGWIQVRLGKRAGLFTIPFYFVFMNLCLVQGLFRFWRGGQTDRWERSLRQQPGMTA